MYSPIDPKKLAMVSRASNPTTMPMIPADASRGVTSTSKYDGQEGEPVREVRNGVEVLRGYLEDRVDSGPLAVR